MKKLLIAALLLLSLNALAQPSGQSGGVINGKTKTGVTKGVGIDSMSANRYAFLVADSVLRVYSLAQKLKLDSVYTAMSTILTMSNIPDAALHSSYGGTKMLGRVTTGSLPTYTNDRLATPLLDEHGFMFTRAYAGEVSVFPPIRSPGDFVAGSYDTLGQQRVTDSASQYFLSTVAAYSAYMFDNALIDPDSSEFFLRQIRDTTASMDQELNGAGNKLGQIETYTNLISTKDSTTMSRKAVVILNTVPTTLSGHDSTTDSRKGVVLLNDSIRVFATNGFGSGGSGGSTSLDAVDSTNLAKAADSNAQRKGVVIVGGSITATAGTTAIYDSTWTAVAMDTAGLGAKASSATVGWQTDTIGLRQHKATDMKLGVKISFANSTPGSDKACFIYAVPWWYDGSSTWYAASGGTTTLPSGANSSYTIAQPNDFVLLGVLSYTTQNQVCQRQFNLSSAFGNTLPDAVSFVVINSTGAAVHTSGNLLYYSLVNKTQR